MKSLANIITISRIVAVGFMFLLIPFENNLSLIIFATVFILSSSSDGLDGWIARKYNTESDFGRILDPVADKILILVLIPLSNMKVIGSFPVFLIFSREFFMMGLRVFSAKKGLIISASFSGKIKTILTLIVCGILIGRVPVEEVPLHPIWLPIEHLRKFILTLPEFFINILINSVVILTIYSFLDYLIKFIYGLILKKHPNKKEAKRILLGLTLPNIATLMNVSSGGISIYFGLSQQFHYATTCILLSNIFDGLDGYLARKFNSQSLLGAHLDSQADFISFGVSPGILASITLINLLPTTLNIFFKWGLALSIGIIYVLAVSFRLIRFKKKGYSSFFSGLPCPIAAGFLSCSISTSIIPSSYSVMISILLSILMISTVPYPHVSFCRKLPLGYLAVNLGFITSILFILFNITNSPVIFLDIIALLLFILTIIYLLSPLFLKKNSLKRQKCNPEIKSR